MSDFRIPSVNQVQPGILVVVEHREPFIRVLVDDKMLWFESYNLVEV